MGAGLAGLSCAITLEKHGVTPTIFEKRARVGDRFVNAESMFHILNGPVKDHLSYLKNEFDINLKPLAEIQKMVFHSKNETGCISGRLGHSNIRGRKENSYDEQLKNQVKTPIQYNSDYSYEELCKNYDAVVLATGDSEYASLLGNYRTDISCTVRGVSITGEFQPNMPHVWFNYDVLPKGYGWVIPFSDKEANMVIFYPNYPSNIKRDINEIWDRFYETVTKAMDQSFTVIDKFEVTKYLVGVCNKPKIENTYFTGNCFGAISPGLGFGQFTSILTGVYSAYDICEIGDYVELTKPLRSNYENSLVLRQFMELMTDKDFDFNIKNLNIKLISQLANKVCGKNNKMDVLKDVTPLMKIYNKFKDKTQ